MAEKEESEKSEYGSTEGPNSMYVVLISSDGHKFVLKRELAVLSGTIKGMLSGPGGCSVNETNEITLKLIPSHILHMICIYMSYKAAYTNWPAEIPEFKIPAEYSMDILMASTFLEC